MRLAQELHNTKKELRQVKKELKAVRGYIEHLKKENETLNIVSVELFRSRLKCLESLNSCVGCIYQRIDEKQEWCDRVGDPCTRNYNSEGAEFDYYTGTSG
jgi:vacuolar-type H+-ATPase subunit D/Vma8